MMERRTMLKAVPAALAALLLPMRMEAGSPAGPYKKVLVRNERGEWREEQFDDLRVGDVALMSGNGVLRGPYRIVGAPLPCDPPGNMSVCVEPLSVGGAERAGSDSIL